MIPKVDLPSGTKYEDPDLYFPLFTALQVIFIRCMQYRINLEYTMFMQIIINKAEIDLR